MPTRERDRLSSLHSLGILDTPSEERFDRITRLAMLALDVPIALVSLVDADRQWFKSCYGLDVSETDRDGSFCGHAILSDDPLVVEDACEDERFAGNPLVTGEPNVRFYAGFPLSDRDGHKLGTLCVIDRVPRRLTPQQGRLMTELASMAETELNTIATEVAIFQRDAIRRRLDATTHAIADGLITTDESGCIVALNHAAEKIFRSTQRELSGAHLSVLMPDEWNEGLTGDGVRDIVGAIGTGAELLGRRGDGSAFMMELSATMTADGTAIAAVRDITSRREIEDALRHSERLHRSVFAALHEAVMVVDADGVVIAANDRAKELTVDVYALDERVPDWNVGRIRVDGTPMPIEERPLIATLATGEPVSGCVVGFPLESRETLWLEIDTQPLIHADEEKPYAVVVSMDDVTERFALDQLKSQFVSMVSHELRTPLTAIRGALRLITSGALGELPPKASEMVEMADSNTERLVRLVNDILDLQRMESGADELHVQPCTDEDLFEQVSGLMGPLAREAGVTLAVRPAGVSLVADRDRLIQTLSNLVSNAVKFSEDGDRVILAARLDGDRVHFNVSDNGRGIPSDKLESIFGRFQQVEASDSRAKGGTGLGLAICKEIVERHGGSIRVESELGSGSTFAFTIPTESPLRPEAGEPAGADDHRLRAVGAS
jgi:PAS domain S-box-containing protein